MADKQGRFIKGQRPSPATEFKPGQHWRPRKPFWSRDWLYNEYVVKGRSCSDIGKEYSVTDNAISFWLSKHHIPGRSTSETRKLKRWGLFGAKNGMYGRRGILSSNWKGGLTPARQVIYAKSEWKKLCRDVHKRDKTCRLCGSPTNLQVHHIEPFSQSPLLVMDIGNVILLCALCHRKIQKRERRWRNKLYRLMKTQEGN